MPLDPGLEAEIKNRGLTVPGQQSPGSMQGLWDEIAKRGLKVDKPAESEQTSVTDALWEGLKRGMLGATEFGARVGGKMMQAGPEEGAGAFDVPQQRQAAGAAVPQQIQQAQQAYAQKPAVQHHPIAAGIGELTGGVAASAPLMAIPGAGGAGLGVPGRALLGAALGGTTGGPWGALAGGGLGAAGAAIGPALSQRMAGIAQDPRFVSLMRMATGAEGRTEEAFQRATANEVLRDIGKQVPTNIKPGEALINHAHDEVSDVYKKILPQVTFRGSEIHPDTGQSFSSGLPDLIAKVPEGHEKDFASVLKDITKKLDPGGNMSGKEWQDADRMISREVKYYSTYNADGSDRKYVDVLRELQGNMRDTLALHNPQQKDALMAANSSWHKLALMEEAAGRRIDSNGQFRPNDLLMVGRRETGNRRFAQGQGVFNAFGRAGNDLLTSKPPNFNRYLADIMGAAAGGGLGGMAGHAMGGPVGGYAGATAGAGIGAAAAEAGRGLVSGLRARPGARELGAAISRAAPVAGEGEDRDAYVSPAGP